MQRRTEGEGYAARRRNKRAVEDEMKRNTDTLDESWSLDVRHHTITVSWEHTTYDFFAVATLV